MGLPREWGDGGGYRGRAGGSRFPPTATLLIILLFLLFNIFVIHICYVLLPFHYSLNLFIIMVRFFSKPKHLMNYLALSFPLTSHSSPTTFSFRLIFESPPIILHYDSSINMLLFNISFLATFSSSTSSFLFLIFYDSSNFFSLLRYLKSLFLL